MMRHIPNFITSLNLTSGFIAVIFAANGDLTVASWLILAAMIFDFCDGFSARMLKAYSPVGRELDSLADVVSFGVAPAMIIFKMICTSNGIDKLTGGFSFSLLPVLLIPAMMAVFAALRLAIFNVDETQATTFRGLPTPANALAVVSIVIASHYSGSGDFAFITGSPAALILLTLVLSFLMVSRIPLLSLKISNFRIRGNEGRYLMIILIILGLAIFGLAALPLIIPVYIAASLFDLIYNK